jgi:filamentous hemagglutinin family protein
MVSVTQLRVTRKHIARRIMKNTIRRASSVVAATAIVAEPGMVKRMVVAVLATCVVVASGASRANPDGVTVVNGQVTISRPNASTLNITNSNGSILNWNSFSIRPAETTRFIQPNAASGVLNRVLGRDPSDLLGTLQSNGRVFLVNPNGIVFGPGAVIDTAGLVASTLNMSDADFLAGRMRFATVDSAGQIVNQGTLRAGANGQILLIAPNIRNEGVIETKNGKIVLAAGRKVELTGPGLEDVYFEVQAPEDQIVNLGRIDATDGAARLFAGTLRHSGTIQANGLARDAAGEIVLTAKQDIEIESGSRLEANGKNGGAIRIESEKGTTSVLGAVQARGSTGKGGAVILLGNDVSASGNATIDVLGDTGGGTVLLGGNLHGHGPERNAAMVDVGVNTAITADATTNGDGGKIIVWADNTANINGTLSARGGSFSGNGGFIETSAKRSLYLSRAADASASRGSGGTWLIDPADITIVKGGGELGTNRVSNDAIAKALNGGTNVTLDTAKAVGGESPLGGTITQVGDANIAKRSGGDATLTLNAQNNIDLQGSIEATSGRLNLNINADNDKDGNGGAISIGAISTNGGNITISSSSSNINIVRSISSGGGNIALTADSIAGLASLSGTGDLTLQPFSPTQSIRIGRAIGDGFRLSQGDLDHISGFRSVTIGRPDGRHAITVANVKFLRSTHIRAPTGGSIQLDDVTASGDMVLEASDMTIGNILTGAGGVITVSNSGVGIQAPGTIISGSSSLVKEGAGSLTLSSGNTYTGTTTINLGTLRLGGTNSLPSSTALKVNGGTLDLQGFSSTVGSVALNGGTITGTATLTAATYDLAGGNVNANLGAGTLNQTANDTNLIGTSAANVVNVTGGTLRLGSSTVPEPPPPAPGRLSDVAAVLVDAGGTLDVSAEVAETVGSVDQQRGGIIRGNLKASGEFVNNGTLVIASNRFFGRLTNNGTVDIQSGSLSTSGDYTQAAGETQIAAGTFLTPRGGRFVLNGGTISGAGTISGDLANNGGTVAPSGLLTVTGNCVQSAGSTRINGGSTLAVPGGFTLAGGTLSGNGTIQGNVFNSGARLAPGASPGTLIINGNYTQAPGATLDVELGGPVQGVSYDLLDISGHASLAGSLNVVLTGGFFPASGSSFDVLKYGSVSGDFSAINGPPGVAFAGKPNPSAYGLGSGGPPLVQDPTLLQGDKDDSNKSCQR